MTKVEQINFAIVDYGLGNLFSIKNACEHVGVRGIITSSGEEILDSDAVILPGVGAFGDAMDAIRGLELIGPLREFVASGKVLVGICLGMQLLMTESYEFGRHQGLDIISGKVVPFEGPIEPSGKTLKVPLVGWNHVNPKKSKSQFVGEVEKPELSLWSDTVLEGLPDGQSMYFCHSYYVIPDDSKVSVAVSSYGQIEFCSCILDRNVFACQFHPERSGQAGLHIYRNMAMMAKKYKKQVEN